MPRVSATAARGVVIALVLGLALGACTPPSPTPASPPSQPVARPPAAAPAPVRANATAGDFVHGCVASGAGHPVRGAVLRADGVDLAWTARDGRFAVPVAATTGPIEVLFGDRVCGTFDATPGEVLVRVAGRHEAIRSDPDGAPYVRAIYALEHAAPGATVTLRTADGTTFVSDVADLDGTAPFAPGTDLSGVVGGRVDVSGRTTRPFEAPYRRGGEVFAARDGATPQVRSWIDAPFPGAWRYAAKDDTSSFASSGTTTIVAEGRWTIDLPRGSVWVVGDRWIAHRRVTDEPLALSDVTHAVTLEVPLPGELADHGFRLVGQFPGAGIERGTIPAPRAQRADRAAAPALDLTDGPAQVIELLDRIDERQVVIDTGAAGAPVTFDRHTSDDDRSVLFWHPQLSRPRTGPAPLPDQWGPIVHTGAARLRVVVEDGAGTGSALVVGRVGGSLLREFRIAGNGEVLVEALGAGAFFVQRQPLGADGEPSNQYWSRHVVLDVGATETVTFTVE